MIKRKITKPVLLCQNPMLDNYARVYNRNEGYVYESKAHNNFKYKEVAIVGGFSIDYTKDDISLGDKKISGSLGRSDHKTVDYEIYIYGPDIPIPHFHIMDVTKDKRVYKTDCQICIFESKYLASINDDITNVLNDKEKKALDDFLRSKFKEVSTYWNAVRNTWELLNPDNKEKFEVFRYETKQPDYTTLKEYRSPWAYIR